MRDYVLIAAVLFALIATFAAPYIGVLAWTWISIMNPHRLSFGFAFSLPFVQIIAITTFFAWLFSKEPKRLPNSTSVWLLVILTILMIISTFTGLNPDYSLELLTRNLKTLALALTIIILINAPTRMHALIWIIATSLGFFAVKGALFGLVTGGANRVWGPTSSMISDNNHFALALNMLLPLLIYLFLHSRHKFVRLAVAFVFFCTIVSILLTFSRGGLITLSATTLVLVFRSRYRWRGIILATIISIGLLSALPTHWYSRMDSILTAEQDASFMNRVYAWKVCWEIAKRHPLTGGGFRAYENMETYNAYNPGPIATRGRAAHSIYFEVLGDLGILGLFLYLLLGAATFFGLSRTKLHARGDPAKQWILSLATSLQISMFAFFLGGAALSMAYYDLYFLFVAIAISLRELAKT